MGVSAKKRCCLLYSTAKCFDRQMWKPLRMDLLYCEAICKHIDNLGNTDTSVFNRDFSTCPFRTLIKVFHSKRILTRRAVKVKFDSSLCMHKFFKVEASLFASTYMHSPCID